MYIPQVLESADIAEDRTIPEPMVSISPFLWVIIAIGPFEECLSIQSLNWDISIGIKPLNQSAFSVATLY